MRKRLVSKELSDIDGEVGKGSWVFESKTGGREDEEMWTLKGREKEEGRVSEEDQMREEGTGSRSRRTGPFLRRAM